MEIIKISGDTDHFEKSDKSFFLKKVHELSLRDSILRAKPLV